LWVLDRQHFGRPLPPLAADVWRRQGVAGTNRAFEGYQLPVRLEMLAINGYLYNCYRQIGLPPDAVLKGLNAIGRVAPRVFRAVRGSVAAGMAARYMPKIAPVIANLQTYWQHSWMRRFASTSHSGVPSTCAALPMSCWRRTYTRACGESSGCGSCIFRSWSRRLSR
jgi:hypothetical protein